MNDNPALSQWLSQHAGTLAADDHCHFDGVAVEPTANMIAPLTHYGFVDTSGADSIRFLQGQASSDFAKTDSASSLPGCFCSPKGRGYASFLAAVDSAERVLLRMVRNVIPGSRERLAKYIVFSKAQQTDVSDQYLAIGLHGPQAAANIAQVFGQCPQALHQRVSAGDNSVTRLVDGDDWFECWVKFDQLDALWPQLSEQLALQGSESWQLAMIRLGLAEIGAGTEELFIPQMLNYHLTGAVSFTKGCYTGQEVVARLQYKGAVKRQLYRIGIEGAAPSPGTALFRVGEQQAVGDIVSSVALDGDRAEALAVISIKDVEAGTALQVENSGPVEVLSLPYAITN